MINMKGYEIIFPSRWMILSKFSKMQFYLSIGLRDKEIADRVNVSRVTINRWKNELRKRFIIQEKNMKITIESKKEIK